MLVYSDMEKKWCGQDKSFFTMFLTSGWVRVCGVQQEKRSKTVRAWKWRESSAMALTVTQLNTNGRFWTNALNSALHHHYQTTKWGNIFWKDGVPSLQSNSRDLYNLCQWAMKLFWQHMVTQHLSDNTTTFFLWGFRSGDVVLFSMNCGTEKTLRR